MEQRRVIWTAPYGGAVGQLIAVIVLIVALVMWIVGKLDGTSAAFFGALALARLL